METTGLLLIDLGTLRTELNEPIGIGALTSNLRRCLGTRCRIDQRLFPIDSLPSVEDLAQFDAVGLATRLASLSRLRTIRDRLQQMPETQRPLLILGDLIATFATRELLAEVPEAICVIGEGEESIVGIIEALLDIGRESHSVKAALLEREIPNLAMMHQGMFRVTQRKLVDLRDMPPPDRSLTREIARRAGIVRAEASRGCAWGRCNFCAIQYKYCDRISWRRVEIERIVEELAELSTLGVRSPYYTDEDFIGSEPHRALDLARAIQQARNDGRISRDMTLYIDARVDTIMAPAHGNAPSGETVFRELARAGVREVFIGIESGAREQVRRYRKAATAERNERAMKLLLSLGITLDIGFIMFDPEMRLDELRINIDFIETTGLASHDARLTKRIRVEPGTSLVDEYRKKDLLTGPLNPDLLVFPYRWVDSRVEAVHASFSQWEAPLRQTIYTIQAETRGELPDEDCRRRRREHLGRLRAVEMAALSSIVRNAEEGRDPLSADLTRFTRLREALLNARPG